MNEIWKDIEGYNGDYRVSNLGRVMSLKKGMKRILKGRDDGQGYLKVALYDNKIKPRNVRVHRLVAVAFLERSLFKVEVNHINGIKDDNSVLNLEWCNRSHNQKHAYRTGLKTPNPNKGEKSNLSKLSKNQVLEIKKMIANGKAKIKDIANKYSVTPSAISLIKSGKNWSHI